MTKRYLIALVCYLLSLVPSLAQDGYKQLEQIASAQNGLNVYLFQVATNKCWEINYLETVGDEMRFDVTGHSGDLVVNTTTGDADIPWRWRIEKRVLSSAEQVVNRCLPAEVRRSFAAGSISRTDEGIPYLWTFKSATSFCARMGVYTTCATDCRLSVPRASEIYGIALTKEIAEQISKASC